jgi:hypothetical protein
VLAVPIRQQVDAGVIDVVEIADVDMHLGSRLQLFEFACKHRQANERR